MLNAFHFCTIITDKYKRKKSCVRPTRLVTLCSKSKVRAVKANKDLSSDPLIDLLTLVHECLRRYISISLTLNITAADIDTRERTHLFVHEYIDEGIDGCRALR